MSSTASSPAAGPLTTRVTKHHVCGTNGIGDPLIVASDVEPGSIIRYGVAAVPCLVLSNHEEDVEPYYGTPCKLTTLLLYGCFCDDVDVWYRDKLIPARFGPLDTVSILMEP